MGRIFFIQRLICLRGKKENKLRILHPPAEWSPSVIRHREDGREWGKGRQLRDYVSMPQHSPAPDHKQTMLSIPQPELERLQHTGSLWNKLWFMASAGMNLTYSLQRRNVVETIPFDFDLKSSQMSFQVLELHSGSVSPMADMRGQPSPSCQLDTSNDNLAENVPSPQSTRRP